MRSDQPAPTLSPHPEEPRSGVSKDAPDVSGESWSILRDAVPDGTAPQDEGSGAARKAVESGGAEGFVRYEARGGLAWLILDQPDKLNAMTYGMWASLEGLVARAEADPAIRAIVVTGAGDRAFCAGADISEFGGNRAGQTATQAYDSAYLRGCAALAKSEKPSLALIRGICFGGGLGLAMSCDLRLARADARFRVPAARLGLGYAYEGVRLLVQKLGAPAVADLLMSARILAGEEALRLGAVNALWSAESFEAEAEAYLDRLAGNAPLTLRAVKRTLVALAEPEATRDIAAAEAAIAACFASADYAEGQTAFKEKREPAFIGR